MESMSYIHVSESIVILMKDNVKWRFLFIIIVDKISSLSINNELTIYDIEIYNIFTINKT